MNEIYPTKIYNGIKTLQDFYREYRKGCNPITGEPNLFKNISDEMIWVNSRYAVLEELEAKIKEREGILVYGEKKFLDTVRMEEVNEILSLLANMKEGTK